jgi:hypothetical protein
VSAEEIRALGVTVDVPTFAELVGIGRTKAYELARAGELPVPVLRFGSRLVVPVAPILKLLGLADDQVAPVGPGGGEG